jgi:acetolactate synthase-1/2/3 large subunit
VKITGGQALAGQLAREGVRDVFGVPGVQLDWAVDALCERADEIRFVVPRHEQAVTYMADGYARSTGRVGVGMVVPGPGMLNALAGLATAYACNSRLLFIAGQLPSAQIGQGLGMLHEIRGQSEILSKLTKWQCIALSPGVIPAIIDQAFSALNSGRPQPVAVEVPQDVLQRAEECELIAPSGTKAASLDQKAIDAAAMALKSARLPVIIAGGGVLAAGASVSLARLAEGLQTPVLVTENGTGALPAQHPLTLTWLASRALLPHADVVLAVGTRLIEGGAPVKLAAGARVIYVNAENADMGPPRPAGQTICADAKLALEALADGCGTCAGEQRGDMVQALRGWCTAQLAEIAPQLEWIAALRAAIPDDGFLVPDLTQMGYPSSLAFPVRTPGTFINAGYQGTLGFAYPTALGVAAGNPGRAVVSISGDGGFGWCLQELATARRYGLGVVAVVFSDGFFGNVKLLQKRQFGRAYGAELQNPDFVRLAESFGVDAARATTPDALRATLASAIAAGRPALIEVPVGEFPSPWHLLRNYAPGPRPAPPNPLGEPQAPGAL